MPKTKIEWSGHSWNPITGCSHAGSPGCDRCYARRMARRLAGRCGYPEAPNHFDVTLHRDRLEQPLKRRKPTTYFVCSMSDLFHRDVPFTFISEVWLIAADRPHHTFQILTKRPRRMLEYVTELHKQTMAVRPLSNVWLGVSCENQAAADERIPLLLQTPAAVRFVSAEPLLGPVKLRRYLPEMLDGHDLCGFPTLSWVIVGGESGPGARPMHPDWARGIRDQCVAAGVPFFFKGWGAWVDLMNVPSETILTMGANDPKRHWQWSAHGESPCSMVRVGKKCAGRLLDGHEHNEIPKKRG